MKNYSLTITGIIVSVVGTLLAKYGFSESCSTELITNVPLLIGGLMSWIGRVRNGDINIVGVRK